MGNNWGGDQQLASKARGGRSLKPTAESGGRVLGRGQPAPPHQLLGLGVVGERCKFPQCGQVQNGSCCMFK